MGFWFFMLIMVMFIPLTMVIFGRLFMKKAPRTINYIYGYRTTMSMKNKDTWNFAHKHCGRIWYYWGLILFLASIVVMLFYIGNEIDTVGTIGGIVVGIQALILIVSIFPTSIALHKEFDKNGRRKK